MQLSRPPYLCCYDYGQGAVWLLADAASPEEIRRKYPKLTVFVDRPDWMTSDGESGLRQELEANGFRWNVQLPPTGWLISHAHECGAVSLPQQILQALGDVVPELQKSGFIPLAFDQSSSFGNFFVTFAAQHRALTIAQDRGQLLVSGPPRDELQESGLWEALSGSIKLHERLKAWLAPRSGV